MRKKGPLSSIERWIIDNCKGRKIEIPLNYDRQKVIYWKIGKLVYGPILWETIPNNIRNCPTKKERIKI